MRPAAHDTGDVLLVGTPSDGELTRELVGTVYRPRGRGFQLLLLVALLGTGMLLTCITITVTVGIGTWGNNIPVGWAFGIINFVWWIGIGHAGTFISAILYLFEQPWRTSINRFAEGMTLFAVVQAGLYPVLHLGRPWFAYWLIPYPSTMSVWPNFKSALPWDAAAIATYLTVSFLFWFFGLIPDFAACRDQAPPEARARRVIYGLLALGWRGSAQHHRHYRVTYGLLAALATPLVLSVHSIVSTDFAITLVPGWHSTIFPPFFVAGAILSGFAMVITLAVPTRWAFGLQRVVTKKHFDAMGKMILTTGWIVTYAYVVEIFIAWYSGEESEIHQFLVARPFTHGSWVWWGMMLCNVGVTQLFWSRRFRTNLALVWIASLLINFGMWAERYVIIVLGLQRDFLPSSWADYLPTLVDLGLFAGTMSFFLLLFILFLRYIPFIAAWEVKELAHELRHHPHEGAE
jgi:molybdopterin-containing oxidoreductase family membrane subunit